MENYTTWKFCKLAVVRNNLRREDEVGNSAIIAALEAEMAERYRVNPLQF